MTPHTFLPTHQPRVYDLAQIVDVLAGDLPVFVEHENGVSEVVLRVEVTDRGLFLVLRNRV